MGKIQLSGVCKSFGSHEVIRNVDLVAEDGEFIVFVGPSGCGKSTLLRMIAGLEEVTSGQIFIDGLDVTKLDPYHRNLSMVFQSYALYPHMTVFENIAFALQTAKVPAPDIKIRVHAAAKTLQLTELLDRKPKQLSGGQRQRVAIGRAIVRDPQGFLFDEPLSNLDAALRGETRVEIAQLHKDLAATMIYVTHDQVEAMTLADRIVVLNQGQIMQIGTPRELYERPANTFVAQFIGSPKMNLLDVIEVDQNEFVLGGGHRLPYDGPKTLPMAKVGLRPEHIRLVHDGETPQIEGLVRLSEYHGSALSLVVDAGDSGDIAVTTSSDTRVNEGDMIGLAVRNGTLHAFSETGDRIAF